MATGNMYRKFCEVMDMWFSRYLNKQTYRQIAVLHSPSRSEEKIVWPDKS